MTLVSKAAGPPSKMDSRRSADNMSNFSANLSHIATERSNSKVDPNDPKLLVFSPPERRRAERLLFVEKFSGGLAGSPNSITVEFLTRLGLNEFHFGWLGLLGWLAQPANLAAALLTEYTGWRKIVTVFSAGLVVVGAGGMVLMALWRPPASTAVPMLIGLTVLITIAGSVSNVNMFPWMRDLTGEEHWGKFLANRIAISRLTIPLALLYGILIEWGKKGSSDVLFFTFAFLYGIVGFFAVVRTLALARTPDPRIIWHDKTDSSSVLSFIASIGKRIGQSSPLRRYLVFAALQSFGGACTGAFLGFYMVNTLRLSQVAITFSTAILGSLCSGFASVAFRRFQYRISNRQWAIWGVGINAGVALAWIFAREARYLYLFLIPTAAIADLFIVFGATGGILLQITPGHRRAVYLSLISFLVTFCPAFLPPLLGKWILMNQSHFWAINGFTIVPIQLALILSAVFYGLAWVVGYRWLVEKDSLTVG